MTSPRVIITDVRIGSYEGDKVRVTGSYDAINGILAISKVLPYDSKVTYEGKTPEQIEKIKTLQRYTMIVVDSANSFPKWDLHFQEKLDLPEAARAYYELVRSDRLKLGKEVANKYNLASVIQLRKLEIGGSVYELNPEETENGHIAILASCWAAIRAMATSTITNTEEVELSSEHHDDFLVPFSI
ncbi:hypothetical protein ACRS5A_18345 [Acinetobacter baumannii]|uniref:hypothetical protein n=1 Tax=Acinetobacter baumannii TaxID=470 RepID=UPI003B2E3671